MNAPDRSAREIERAARFLRHVALERLLLPPRCINHRERKVGVLVNALENSSALEMVSRPQQRVPRREGVKRRSHLIGT
jgi:hypothetical protein